MPECFQLWDQLKRLKFATLDRSVEGDLCMFPAIIYFRFYTQNKGNRSKPVNVGLKFHNRPV